MSKEITYDQALSKLAVFCSQSEQCLQVCREKLAKWNISETDAEKILRYLVEEKYIDERRYARFFTNDKHSLAHWGRNKIVSALRLKKIPQNYINEALEGIQDDTYENQLYDLLLVKLKNTKAKNEYDLKAKLFRFAIGRGFESNLSLKIIDKLLKNNNIETSEDYEIYNI